MRIVAGSAKGIRLGPVPEGVRPLSDRAREGLFSSLGAVVAEARVLDLFSGTGAMGIEALSRGAAHATFVERNHRAAAVIHDNLDRAHVADRATVMPSDAMTFVRGDQRHGGSFDLVLADPPYELGSPEMDDVLRELASGWLSEGRWTVMLTRGVRSSMPVIPLHWSAARALRYGDSLLTLFQPDDQEA